MKKSNYKKKDSLKKGKQTKNYYKMYILKIFNYNKRKN